MMGFGDELCWERDGFMCDEVVCFEVDEWCLWRQGGLFYAGEINLEKLGRGGRKEAPKPWKKRGPGRVGPSQQ